MKPTTVENRLPDNPKQRAALSKHFWKQPSTKTWMRAMPLCCSVQANTTCSTH